MKLHVAALLLLSTLNPQLSTVFAQGSLTPPGGPAATMKSLDQIEARTAITNASSTYTISVPGSYYLTRNLTVSSGDAIDITTNGVTLDLNGFTLSSTCPSAAGNGILLNSGLSDITIVNGHICSGVTINTFLVYSGPGFSYGIGYISSPPTNVVVSKVSVSGVLQDGINLGNGTATVVEACTVTTAGGQGIVASTIKSAVATGCGGNAIHGDQVADCRGVCSYGSGTGVYANSTAQNCYGYSYAGTGVNAYMALNCYGYAYDNYIIGVSATIANSCYGYSGGYSAGLNATMATSCYGYSGSYGTGLIATYGDFCFGHSGGGTAVSVPTGQKWNMLP